MDATLLDLCQQTLTLEAPGSPDGFGGTAYGAAVAYPARIRGEAKLVRAADGQERVSSTVAWVPGPPDGPATIDPLSRATLPDGSQPPILAIESMPDETGAVDHFKVRFA